MNHGLHGLHGLEKKLNPAKPWFVLITKKTIFSLFRFCFNLPPEFVVLNPLPRLYLFSTFLEDGRQFG